MDAARFSMNKLIFFERAKLNVLGLKSSSFICITIIGKRPLGKTSSMLLHQQRYFNLYPSGHIIKVIRFYID